MIMGHILKFKKKLEFMGMGGALRGLNPIFSKIFFYSSVISLWIQISFQMIIFNFNPRNGHYLHPPFFFPIQGLKKVKGL